MTAQMYGEKHYPHAKREYRELIYPSEGGSNVIKMPQQPDSPDVVQESGTEMPGMQKTGKEL